MFAADALGFGNEQPTMSWYDRGDSRVLNMSNVAVFRSGTFRNSYGEQDTFTDEDMDLFVSNFNHLSASGILPKVPVRKGHRSYNGAQNMDGLIGYVTALRVTKKVASIEQKEYSFLVADYEILDKDAQEKIGSGLWVNRSAEIGVYRDNNDTPYAPTFMGFAYVDVPAVERLNEFAKANNFNIMMEEVMSGTVTPPPAVPAITETPKLQEFALGGATVSDPVAIQMYINDVEARLATFTAAESARAAKEREDYVSGLEAAKKVTSPQVPGLKAFAQTLTDEQFAVWRGQYDNAPALPILGEHGGQDGDAGHVGQTPSVDSAYDTAVAIVSSLAKAHVPVDKIKTTGSYAAVIAKNPGFQLPNVSPLGK